MLSPQQKIMQPKVKVFSSKAAVCFESVCSKDGYPTVNIEVARKSSSSESFDWGAKLILQLDERELPTLAALFLGIISLCEFKRDDKGLRFERQAGKIYMAASRKSVIGVPITHGDGFRICAQLLGRLEESSHCSPEMIVASLRGVFTDLPS